MGLTPYSTEMFFALLDVNTAVSVASSATDDRVDAAGHFIHTYLVFCSKFASQEQIVIYFCRCHYI